MTNIKKDCDTCEHEKGNGTDSPENLGGPCLVCKSQSDPSRWEIRTWGKWREDKSKPWRKAWRREDNQEIVVAQEGRGFQAYIAGSFNNCVKGPRGNPSTFKFATTAMAAADKKWPPMSPECDK